MSRCMELLMAAGMSAGEAAAKKLLFERTLQAMPRDGERGGPPRAFYVPGRIEILGKHTDYAGGRSLLCTVERGFCLIARPRQDDQVQVINARSRARCSLALSPKLKPSERLWCNYPGMVARRMARNFPNARQGADIAFISDLPAASGMSSSSALMVAVFLALADVNDLENSDQYRREIHGPEDLAGYLGAVENGESFGSLAGDLGVGTFGGSEDHVAILCCRPGELSQYSFCPIRHERNLKLPDDHVLIVGVSGVAAIKTGESRARFNRMSLAARAILETWRAATGRHDPTLAAAVASDHDAPDRIRRFLDASTHETFPASELRDRLEQFLDESMNIIPSAGAALAAGDLPLFGALTDRSQKNAESLLGNQVPETVDLVRAARSLGAVAASAFGAGFGGSVWALCRVEHAAEFERRWATWYRVRFPGVGRARFFRSFPGPPAMRLNSADTEPRSAKPQF